MSDRPPPGHGSEGQFAGVLEVSTWAAVRAASPAACARRSASVVLVDCTTSRTALLVIRLLASMTDHRAGASGTFRLCSNRPLRPRPASATIVWAQVSEVGSAAAIRPSRATAYPADPVTAAWPAIREGLGGQEGIADRLAHPGRQLDLAGRGGQVEEGQDGLVHAGVR